MGKNSLASEKNYHNYAIPDDEINTIIRHDLDLEELLDLKPSKKSKSDDDVEYKSDEDSGNDSGNDSEYESTNNPRRRHRSNKRKSRKIKEQVIPRRKVKSDPCQKGSNPCKKIKSVPCPKVPRPYHFINRNRKNPNPAELEASAIYDLLILNPVCYFCNRRLSDSPQIRNVMITIVNNCKYYGSPREVVPLMMKLLNEIQLLDDLTNFLGTDGTEGMTPFDEGTNTIEYDYVRVPACNCCGLKLATRRSKDVLTPFNG